MMIIKIAENLYNDSRVSFGEFIDDITEQAGRPLTGHEISQIVNEYFFEIEENCERLDEE